MTFRTCLTATSRHWALTNYENKIAGDKEGDKVEGDTVKDSKNKYQSPNVLLSELNYYEEDITLDDNLGSYIKEGEKYEPHKEILRKIEDS